MLSTKHRELEELARSPREASTTVGTLETPKRFREGTHRAVPIEATLAKLKPILPRLGITRVANVTGLDIIGIPVVAAHRPNSRSLSVSFGKGATLEAARASAMMEAIESHHAESIERPLLNCSHSELSRRRQLVNVAALPRLTASSYHKDKPLLWIEGRELRSSCGRWLPYELVHTDFRLPLPTGSGAFCMSSNGLASGNRLVEAELHALCEVVERDATTLWHTLSPAVRARTKLDLATVHDPLCRGVIETVERAGLAVGVWETTSNVGVPAFLATLVERDTGVFGGVGHISGMGCHTSREIALLRALTEAVQGRLTIISGARDDLTHQLYREKRHDGRTRRAYQRAVADPVMRSFADVPSHDGESFEADLGWTLDRLAEAGIPEAVSVDLTLPDVGIPVVRVVVPGLELMHDVPGYVPGRRARHSLERRA